ncbi:MAG: hypothetical protein JSW38_08450 [Dehalococcoidia bacterium]|nr:MAG: hypothetical protein JSW38_08450 [Dehalococcoidia bacterium]
MPNENDRIKSALEIAVEKAEKLGDLSEDEKQRQKDEKLVTAAEDLARRYLDGLPLNDIDLELAKHKEEEYGIFRDHLLSHLVKNINFSQDSMSEKMLAAIKHISPESELTATIGDILHEYRVVIDKARQENLGKLEAEKRSELGQLGISGSAIEPSIETSSAWLQIEQELKTRYSQRLDEIKRNLPTS